MLSRADERLLHALQRRKARETEGLFIAEGVRVAEELAASPFDLKFAVISTSLEDNERGRALRASLASRCAVHPVSDAELERHAATEQPQGVLVVARAPDHRLDAVQLNDRAAVLVADAVQDPGNFGTLIRVADAFAAALVIALPGTVDTWNPKVVRAAAGSSFHLPVIATDAATTRTWLHEHDFQTVGAEMTGTAAEDVKLQPRVALVVGNEGAGLTADTRAWVSDRISVRMPGRAESLNVGVAAGILMYLVTRR